MKILHIDPERGFGGGERQVLGLLRHVAAAGHENLLATPRDAAIRARLPPGDARWTQLSIRNDLDLVAAWRFRRLVARERPDVIHYHTARAHKLAIVLPQAASSSVVTRRMDYDVAPGRLTDLLYNHRVAAVAAISDNIRSRLLDAGVLEERIHLIPSGVEVPGGLPTEDARRAARMRFGIEVGEVVLTTVAALERRKGHDVALDALAELGDLSFCWLVAGDGSRRAELERRAEGLGLSPRVQFLGELSQVADLFAATDIFLLPSRREGLGVAVLEAMAAGLPVVASRVGGIPDAVIPEETGLLIPPEDVASLAGAVRRLITNPEVASAMGSGGRARAESHFTMKAMAAAYLSLYERLAAGVPTPPASPSCPR